jgi:two-component system nitrogen regulation sensor histidine kinase GlnL
MSPMPRRHRLAWKLSVVVVAIVTVVILGVGLLESLLSRRSALNATRDVMQFNAESLRGVIDELMMSRNHESVARLFEEISERDRFYQNLSLVRHPVKRAAGAPATPRAADPNWDERTCQFCHAADAGRAVIRDVGSEVLIAADDQRFLRVVTPILNRQSCRTAACHIHTESGPVLGVLRADYSLASFDNFMTGMSRLQALSVVLGALFAFGALVLMFRSLLARPLRRLVSGIGTLATGDLGFRFPVLRDDEIGVVENSFNTMAGRIQAQQRELRRALEYLESIVENTADLVITVNRDGLIQTFNTGAERALGYQRSEVVGRPIERLFLDPEERKIAIARLQEQDNVTNWETRFKTRDGKTRHVLLTISRLRDRRGNLIGTLGISKDITNEKNLQAKLTQFEHAAAIGRAVTGIQHYVKNMLNTLRGGLYIVRVGHKKNRDDQVDEGCAMVEEGISRISGLSLNMLKYARQWTIEPELVDLSDMIDKILVANSQSAKERSVSLRADVAKSLPEVPCDPKLIHMLLMDLLTNAFDACDLKDYNASEQPEVVMRVYRNDGEADAVVEVEDNGIGMEPEVVENVFTPFFSTKKKWGTGLGLALTARVIALHNGTIEVESEPSRGTLFRVTLPLNNQKSNQGVQQT